MTHIFPENYAGSDLSEHQAQRLALQHIHEWYHTAQSDLQLVSIESKKHHFRRDYTIVYKDIVGYTLDQGQGHIVVKLAGDALSSIQRFVYAPESWVRSENSRENNEANCKVLLWLVVVFWLVFAAVLGIRRYGLLVKFLVPIGFCSIILCLLGSLDFANNWHLFVSNLNTSEPWIYQMLSWASFCFLWYFGLSFICLTLCFLMLLQGQGLSNKKSLLHIFALIFLGIGLACFDLFVGDFKILFAASGYYYQSVNYLYPILHILIGHFLKNLIFGSITMMSLCVVARFVEQRLNDAWIVGMFIVSGIVLSSAASVANIALWLGSGLCFGVIWYLLYRCVIVYNIESILLIVFGILTGKMVPSLWYGAYPGFMMHYGIAYVIFLSFLIALYRKI